jgi:amino acid adenylation domain-containing protein
MGTCAEMHSVGRADSQSTCAPTQTNVAETLRGEGIHHFFEAQAAKSPDAIAVVFEERQLTYRELNSRANQLARFLQKGGVHPDSLVAVRAERSLEMIIGIFAVLKAGGAYLPIDPAYPAARQEFMLRDANVRWLLTQSHLPALEHEAKTFQFDRDEPLLAAESAENPESELAASNLAYVIYTSGSTGRPKGVMVTHGNLKYSTTARFQLYPGKVGNFLLLSSCAFDSSVAGIFWTLCAGGTLTLPHEFSQQTASEPADLISRHGISHLLCLPSLYAVLLEQSAALGSLRVVIVAGESCPAALVQRHHERLPRAKLYNEYGPTEATVWTTVHPCSLRPEASVPIGRPIPGAQIYLLDENQQPAPAGVVGELHIGGAGVARGYLHQPGLTAERFIPDPFSGESAARLYKTGDLARCLPDGNLEFLGRLDHQIKIRGHRVELEEIESVLKRHEAVQDAVVVAREIHRTPPVNGEAVRILERRLAELDPARAETVLSEIESKRGRWEAEPRAGLAAAGVGHEERQAREFPEFEIALQVKRGDFIRPPRTSQRTWLLQRALDEFADDLHALDALARRFVPGVETGLETLTMDRTQAVLGEQEILEDWHIPLMRAMARAVTETRGDVLEIGFGRGLAASFIQENRPRSHTIIECNDSVISRFFEPWRKRFADRDVQLVRGKWQDVIAKLGRFDGILFQTYPLNEREFAEYLSRSITFAEHFFPTAAMHLNRGAAFTYLTHEMDSLSRRHQRLIFQYFSSVTLNVERLQLPADCRDLWWADSMVVARAVK